MTYRTSKLSERATHPANTNTSSAPRMVMDRFWWCWSWLLLLGACTGLAACTNAVFKKVTEQDASIVKKDGGNSTSDAIDAPANPVCVPGKGDRAKGKTEECACDDECQSGHCVDGVCCSSACEETCKACNLPSSLGDCAYVPAGGKPSDPSVCAASAARTCGQDGTCDGKGGCRLYLQGTECKAGRCDGDRVADIQTCDGKGNCAQNVSRTCPPYTCDTNTNRCATSCTTSDQCVDGQECVAGRCGTSPNGAECASAEDCTSGYCVDNVCCNIACSGACVSCNQTGSVGRCSFVTAGMEDPGCATDKVATCGYTGRCDGTGSCALFPENTVCAPSSCSGEQENAPRTCDGRGTCRDAQLIECAPYLCSGGVCQTSCDPNRSGTCAGGNPCQAATKNGVTIGICGLRSTGQPCSDATDCQSGACVDGVCCENSCQGACRSCNLAGSPGRCLNVAAGAADPRGTCKDLGASACSTNGQCDGRGACQSYAAGTTCGSQSCVSGLYSPPPTCNASGQCVASRSQSCSPYACNGDTCYDACSTSAECVPGGLCTNGSCGLKPPGAMCAAGKECSSGFCAQGVCCDKACTDACMACNLTASAGICAAVADGSPDPQGKCLLTDPALCGTTGTCRKGACAYYAAGLNCAAAVCAGSAAVTPASTCDGSGACRTPATQPCGNFTCANGACKTSCTSATEAVDCTPPNTCVNSSCGLKANGAACTDARQCQSGVCTEGVCCNTACADAPMGSLCKTCRGTRTSPTGTCANVEAGGADPKSRCRQSAVASGDCSNDGTCNGSGACRPWTAGTGCRQESCTGNTHTDAATCDGAGRCPTAAIASCGAYVCNTTSPTCLNRCNRKEDCSGTNVCSATTTQSCGDKLGPGEPCLAAADCATGLVCSAEGVCCDKACAGGCQSCKLAASLGVCKSLAAGSTPAVAGSCVVDPSVPCGNTGLCGGDGACQKETTCTPVITSCPTTDPTTEYSASGTCTAGTCQVRVVACATGYVCVGTACATRGTCTSSSGCAAGYTCNLGNRECEVSPGDIDGGP